MLDYQVLSKRISFQAASAIQVQTHRDASMSVHVVRFQNNSARDTSSELIVTVLSVQQMSSNQQQ